MTRESKQCVASRTKIVNSAAWATISAPAQHPTAAEAVGAVLRLLTFIPSFMIAPAPRNPIPETTNNLEVFKQALTRMSPDGWRALRMLAVEKNTTLNAPAIEQ